MVDDIGVVSPESTGYRQDQVSEGSKPKRSRAIHDFEWGCAFLWLIPALLWFLAFIGVSSHARSRQSDDAAAIGAVLVFVLLALTASAFIRNLIPTSWTGRRMYVAIASITAAEVLMPFASPLPDAAPVLFCFIAVTVGVPFGLLIWLKSDLG